MHNPTAEPPSAQAPHPAVTDVYGRPLRKLRVSVTDRCNLRCEYCMPREDYEWLPRSQLLSFDEIATTVSAFAQLGVGVVRLTGGEPLVRRQLSVLVEGLTAIAGIRAVALTTNGLLLRAQAADLHSAGLCGLTVSIDSLRPERFERLTRRDALSTVLAGLDAAIEVGFDRVKTNTVVMRGYNDDEIVDILGFARARGIEPRFIEYMDVGGATRWSPDAVVARAEILAAIADRFGPVTQLVNPDGAPADRFVLADGFVFGVISSTSQPFCQRCDRARLTADGVLFNCLYAENGFDLRPLLRNGADGAAIRSALAIQWRARRDRGAEERLGLEARGPFVPLDRLRQDPYLEMHKRGG